MREFELELEVKDEKEILELCRRSYLNKEIDKIIKSLMKNFNLSENDINNIIKLVYTAKDCSCLKLTEYVTDRKDTTFFNNETLELILDKLNNLYDFISNNREVIYNGKQ